MKPISRLILATLCAASCACAAAGTWNVTTVDSEGEVGYDTSLAFGPDGQPAISY